MVVWISWTVQEELVGNLISSDLWPWLKLCVVVSQNVYGLLSFPTAMSHIFVFNEL